jgi:hypothetical protein
MLDLESDCKILKGLMHSYPSKTADPKGRVLLEPPRKRFQIVWAYAAASLSFAKPLEPVAPPNDIVTIFPAAWQVSILDARNEQLGRFVPGNTGSSAVLQVCSWVRQVRAIRNENLHLRG